jgi:hypothetical protein
MLAVRVAGTGPGSCMADFGVEFRFLLSGSCFQALSVVQKGTGFLGMEFGFPECCVPCCVNNAKAGATPYRDGFHSAI